MPIPGVTVEIVQDAPTGAAVLDTGQAFFAGVAERAPALAIKVDSVADYAANFGARAGGTLLYDSVSAYFAEGGGVLYVSAISGPTAVAASATVGVFTVKARGAGVWGNSVAVRIIDAATTGGTGAVQMVVAYQGVDVEHSPVVLTQEALVKWATDYSTYITLTYTTGTLAPVAAVTLAGGVTDSAVTQTSVDAALARFTYDLGPGQVAIPGNTTTIAYTSLLAHVDATRRVALLDGPNSADPLVVGAAATGLYSNVAAKYGAMFAPWATYPGPAAGSIVTVPYSAVQAGLIARSDAASANPNLAVAGYNGITRAALGLSQTYTDAQRQQLNQQGVIVATTKYGTFRTYGARSVAGPSNLVWLWFSGAREVMAVAHEADAQGENFVFKQIDGQGVLLNQFNMALTGLLLEHYKRGALYGATPQEAFSVATSADVINGVLNATLRLKTSAPAEWVHIVVIHTALDTPLA